MNISENSHRQQLTLQYEGKESTNIDADNMNTHTIKLYMLIPPALTFYQWNDFDLHVLRLFIKSLPVDSSEHSESNTSSETNSIQTSSITANPTVTPSIDFILLLFIRYLQLISLSPWSPMISISDRPFLVPKRDKTDVVPPIPQKNRKQKISQEKQLFEPGLCGLKNIGNTCFMNSAIQCLSNIPQLTEWAKKQKSSTYQTSVTQAYTSLIQSMWSGRNSCVTPDMIKKRVSQHAPIFSDYGQKDSHEFMNSLLNVLHFELEQNATSEEQSSIVTDLFRINTKSEVTCSTCSTRDSIEETTYCLPLPLEDQFEVSVDTLLHDFQKEEPLDGDYYCSTCDALRSATQRTKICNPLPPVIIVQLKRFTFNETNEKLNTFVNYPLVNWRVNSNDSSLYDLVAISMHVGNLKRGHYTTYARLNTSEQWYHFNDCSFEPVFDMNCLVNQNAYVLVYVKQTN